jgi:hypothetical protein
VEEVVVELVDDVVDGSGVELVPSSTSSVVVVAAASGGDESNALMSTTTRMINPTTTPAPINTLLWVTRPSPCTAPERGLQQDRD